MKRTWVWLVIVIIIVAVAYLIIKRSGMPYSSIGVMNTTPGYASSSPLATPQTNGNIITTQAGTKGNYLTGVSGMALYVYDKDTSGVSNCSGSCAGIWPPYSTGSLPANLPVGISTITRSDGSIQYTYKGLPLYYYTGDTQVGDVNGDGVGGIWHLVKP